MLRSLTTAAIFVASTASAQGFEGAQVEYIYHDFPDFGFTSQRLEAGLNYAITNRIGVQVDLGAFSYDDEPITEYTSYGIHAYYDVTDSVAVGAFYATTDFGRGGSESYYGLEAYYTMDALTLDGYAGKVLFDGEDANATVLGFGFEQEVASFAIGDLSLVGSLNRYERDAFSNRTRTLGELGAQLTFNNGLYSSVEWGRELSRRNGVTTSEIDQMTLTVGYEFGAGTRFDQRSYQAIFNGN